MVSEHLHIDKQDFLDAVNLRKNEDLLRDIWKYGTANGMYGTPGVIVNGIKMDFPENESAWEVFFVNLFNNPEE